MNAPVTLGLVGWHAAHETNSVVDAGLRSRDHGNLLLVGSGVFPTIATGNPTLTISALALRTADPLPKDLG